MTISQCKKEFDLLLLIYFRIVSFIIIIEEINGHFAPCPLKGDPRQQWICDGYTTNETGALNYHSTIKFFKIERVTQT